MKNKTNLIFGVTIALLLTIINWASGVVDVNPFIFLICAVPLCHPWKIGRHVWSLFGGVNEHGGIYSLFAFYQRSEDDAFTFSGITFYQEANSYVCQFAGIVFFQKAKMFDATQCFGLVGYQYGSCSADQWVGIAFFQTHGHTNQGLGLVLVQKSDWQSSACQGFGIVLFQEAGCHAEQFAGFALSQKAGWNCRATQGIGICFHQVSCGGRESGFQFGLRIVY